MLIKKTRIISAKMKDIHKLNTDENIIATLKFDFSSNLLL